MPRQIDDFLCLPDTFTLYLGLRRRYTEALLEDNISGNIDLVGVIDEIC